MSTPKKASKSKEINFDALLRAVKQILIENKGYRSTGRDFDLDFCLLKRHCKKLKDKFEDVSSVSDDKLMSCLRESNKRQPNIVFSTEEENELAQYILNCAKHYYGISIVDLKLLAYQLATKLCKCPDQWQKKRIAGKKWYYGFMARHPQLTLRTPQMTSFNRIKAFSKENVEHFFGNFLEILNKTSFNGMSIYNMDETGFSTVPTKAGLVISLKGVRRVGQAAAAERGSMITMALAVNAAGNSIPPFFLFPRKRMQATFMENSSPGSVGFANESGWMQQAEF
ncbi:PREDICTED: uncharacterized protein LOC108777065, partial [Cyphomyrmex costatus]|uniref:uncharacterized protein LOC108777065 n=1 Tax=Cyphomyrmex costatus TaxID=456900 RepID=UPI00085243B7